MAISIVIDEALLLAFALHAALVGAAAGAPLWRALPAGADNFHLRAFFALALGFALDIALVFALGLCGLMRTPALLAAGAAAALGASAGLARRDFRWLMKLGAAELAVTACLYVWVLASAIKVPGFFDDTNYHLPLARFYAETHGLGLDPWVRFPLFPQNMEMLFALAQALRRGDALLAEGFATLPAFAIAIGLVGAARWLRGSWAAAVGAAVLFLALPVVEKTLGYAYVEPGLALFCFAAALGAVLFRGAAPLGVHFALGLLAGTAAGCKAHGLALGALVFVMLLAFRTRWPALAAIALAAALFGCGWYVRSFWISGDPLSPAGGPWFGYFLWDALDLAGQRNELATHGVGTAPWDLPRALIKGGANWLLPALLAPLAARRERGVILALWALFVSYTLVWFYFSQVDRYLAPVHAIGALLSAVCLFDLIDRLADRLSPVWVAKVRRPEIALAAIAAALTFFVGGVLLRADAESRGWNRILAARPGYLALRKAEEAAPRYGDRLVQIGFESARYFYDGALIGDWFGPGRYRQMFVDPPPRLTTAAAMREILARFDARLLALNLEFVIFDRAQYDAEFDTLYNDGKQVLYAVKAGDARPREPSNSPAE